ncbi:DNA-binding transcriptional regulator [Sodalis praecaptivus]|uniref:DNA-binding transcriptional regulator n=1 Tax=Sodalis praecaptivus TaxID=1239307 RepID=W0HV85_9GAMM|nr:molybdenum-dependent transcriptional regulator [Sodalis praecaptivus]AHF77771.1 DNA-binding transcriptional regulator [Sodalis praecaptivus]
MQAEILLTLKLRQQLFADPRRIALLKQIRATGSISQGAKLAGVSYKSAWDAINAMNALAEQALVARATGGKGGGGTTLTRYAERLLQLYDLLGQIQQKAFDVLQDDSLPLDSLLAAIARFSLQTSARNQFFGTIVNRHLQPVQQQVTVALADGNTQLNVALTEKSAERLQLERGKEVLVLIKAPWISLALPAAGAPQADNVLHGTLTHLERGGENDEALILLPGGQQLCATVPTAVTDKLKLSPPQPIAAYFNADQAILATLC